MGKMVEPRNSWFVTVHEDVYFGPTTEISQMSAAALPLLRAVVPHCPAPTGDRVAPRPENNRLWQAGVRQEARVAASYLSQGKSRKVCASFAQ